MKLAEFSVKHSLFANLLAVFLVCAGGLSFLQLKREAFPNVSFDVVTVETAYKGATPEEAERLVTIPLEKELKEVEGIKEMNSSSREGFSTIFLKLSLDAGGKRKVVDDIQTAVDRVGDLPEDAERPIVTDIVSKNMPVIITALSGKLSEHRLQEYAENLEDMFLDIGGVALVKRRGWRDREMWVEADLDKMRNLHISFAEIARAISGKNIGLSAGKMETPANVFNIKIKGEFYTKEEIENVVLRSNDGGIKLLIKDVAKVRDTFEEEDMINKVEGDRAISLVVVKKDGGDAIDIVDSVKRIIKEFKHASPRELKINTFCDLSFYIKRRLTVLTSNGTIGFLLVIISLFLLLGHRVAIWTALGIPIAVCATFWVMNLAGISINLITMFGLIVVMGMLVDDGIIVAENIYRYIEQGLSPREAAIIGTQEVMNPVFATVLTTVAAFSPLIFMSGILGKFVMYIPIVVCIALAASLVEAFVILPSHMADFVKGRSGIKDGSGGNFRGASVRTNKCEQAASAAETVRRGKNSPAWNFCSEFIFSLRLRRNRARKNKLTPQKSPPLPSLKRTNHFKKLTVKYSRLLDRALRHKYKVCIGTFLLFILSIAIIFKFIPFVLFGSKGVEQFMIRAEAKVGTSLSKTEELIRPVEKFVESLPKRYWDTYETQIGVMQEERGFDPDIRQGSHLVQITVYLNPEKQRKKSAKEIIREYREELSNIEGFEKLYFREFKDGPPVGKPIYLRVRGDDYGIINEITAKIKGYLNSVKGVNDVTDGYELGNRELDVVVDEAKAAEVSLSVREVADSVRSAFEGNVATSIKPVRAEEEIDVRLRLKESQRNKTEILDKLFIANSSGNLIPLKKIARIEESQGLQTVRHLDGRRAVYVSGEVEDKYITSSKVNRLLKHKFSNISAEYPGYSIKYGGEEEETAESLKSLLTAFCLAFLLIFMILAVQFNSLWQPFVVMSGIPFSIIGVVFALLLHREPMGFFVILGLVGLTGIVVNDSIVLMDFINRLRSRGIACRESIMQAGELRLRPVLLTTVTTVLGISTVAYGIGGKDPFLQPMALTIAWGLIFATAITLIVLPCIYLISDDIRVRLLGKIY